MKKRALAVVFAAATAFGIAAPSATAHAMDCQRICLMCDPAGNCSDCVRQYILGQEYEIC